MHNIQIDSEFQSLIPPLQAEELAQLEANILSDGCRDPLVAWGNVLVDGHNRYAICTRHGLPFDTVEVEFESRSHAVEWIIKNQFGRRNLSDYQRGVLALRMKPIMEERARAQQLSTLVQNAAVSQISDERKPIRTDEAVSELANVSRDTIRKIERIEEVAAPEVKALAAAGEDVDFGACVVRSMRWCGKWVRPLTSGITCRAAIERLKAYSDNVSRQRFGVIEGGRR